MIKELKEPWYECDYSQTCNCDETEPEWEWDEEQECYVCTGCGDVQ